ncbi:MAG: hypothetical protein K6E94_02490 [Elusimicrobiaceae bacterium]|nr:hypothetical protein [Elusimicrobiaceae bacterium]
MQRLNETTESTQQLPPEVVKQVVTKFSRFVSISFSILLSIAFTLAVSFLVKDRASSKKATQAAYEKALNSPEMQEYRAKQAEKAKKDRELAKQRRLRQMNVNVTEVPTEKDDLLNAKLKEAREREAQEQIINEQQNVQGFDYSAELAAYNAKLQEVQAEEARIRAAAEAKAREEQERIEARKRAEEERRLQMQEQQAKIKAAQEKAAKAQAAKEKAAKAKQAKAKLQKQTEKKVLQTGKSTLGSNSSLQPK